MKLFYFKVYGIKKYLGKICLFRGLVFRKTYQISDTLFLDLNRSFINNLANWIYLFSSMTLIELCIETIKQMIGSKFMAKKTKKGASTDLGNYDF